MKKKTLLVLFILLGLFMQPVAAAWSDQLVLSEADDPVTVIEESDQQIILSFNSPDFEVGKKSYGQLEFDQVNLHGGFTTQARSDYQVPALHKLLGVPPGVEIRLQILDDSVESLGGIYNLAPAEVPVPILTELSPGRYSVPKDPELEPGIYPTSPVALVDDAWLRDQRIIKIAFYPFQYDNRSGALIHHPQIRVAVSFSGSSEIEMASNFEDQDSSPFESYLQNHLLNYEQARSWRTFPGQSSRIEEANQPLPEPPVQSGQTGYKIPVTEDGLYRLTYETLRDAGVPVEGLDLTANHFHISNQGQEVATYLQKNGSIFSPGDFLLFYGQELDGTYLAETYYADEDQHWRAYNSQDINGNDIIWQPEFNAEMIEKYTDENIYWLTIEASVGTSMNLKQNEDGEATVPESYSTSVHAEQSDDRFMQHFTGVDQWFWNRMIKNQTWTFPTILTAVSPGEHTAVIAGEVVSGGFGLDHKLILYLNDAEKANPIDELSWDGRSRMPFSVTISQQLLVEGENRLIVEVNETEDFLLFDWFEIEYQRSFQAVDNRIFFTGEQSGKWQYVVGGFVGVNAEDLWAVNVDDPLHPVIYLQVPYALVGNQGQVELTVSHEADTEFFAGVVSDIDPSRISSYQPVDFAQEVDHIIITHHDLLSTAKKLASYRTEKSISSAVYDFEDIYNQYNFGIYHPVAIKNFLIDAYQNWSVKPSYALLIGDGHWNFKSYPSYNSPPIYMPPNLAWVDPWQGEVDSANLLAAVAGDDQLADLMIGRLLVNSPEELDVVIEKIKSYEESQGQPWQRHFLYVTDNPDNAGDFVESAESIIAEFIHPGNIADRVYLNDYNEDGESITEALVNQINSDSALFVNYFGHGDVDAWADEKLFTNEDIVRLTNAGRFPIFLSSTCLDGYWIHPGKADDPDGYESLIEELIRASYKGAVAAFAATGLGVATGHDTLQQGFYEAVFYDGADRLGEASMAAKMSLYNAGSHLDLLQTYTVFGDPALKIQLQEMDNLLYLPFAVRE